MATENADNIKLKEAIVEVSKLSPKDKVRIHNKYYATVNTRNHIFRKYFGTDASYVSRVEFRDPIFHNDKMIFAGSVVATTELWIKKNMIAVGIAEEIRNSSPVNKTSATENAMTSSLGICLARAGLDGGEFASADEMQIATRNGLAVDELQKTGIVGLNNSSATDTLEKDDKHILPPEEKSNIDSSPGVSESEFNVIRNAILITNHLGQLRAAYTKFKKQIDENKKLQEIYQEQDENFNRNKPTDDGWDI
tara:strand:+ start:980 stop:1732 length:753 start_codon:yes stop_codon:yes gene_type:complete